MHHSLIFASFHIDGLVQDCRISIALAMEILQSCTKPSIWLDLIITHWGRVTHICVGKLTNIGSDNGLSPGRHQAITWTNAGILLIGPLETKFNEILIKIHTISFKEMHLKMPSGKWRSFCLSLNVITQDFVKKNTQSHFAFVFNVHYYKTANEASWKSWHFKCQGLKYCCEELNVFTILLDSSVQKPYLIVTIIVWSRRQAISHTRLHSRLLLSG